MGEAIRLYTVVAIGTIPPEIENTRGAKELSLTLSSRLLLLLLSTAVGTFYDKMGHVG